MQGIYLDLPSCFFFSCVDLFSETNAFLDAFAALKIAEEKFLTVSKSKILLLKLQLLHERALHW